jgi:hypothetical protein
MSCYTCFPSPFHQRLQLFEKNNICFYFDVAKKPRLIISYKIHYTSIYQLTGDEWELLLKTIKEFCDLRNIKDYSLCVNMGKWQKHSHLHFKLKTYERHLNKMRRDHFKLNKLQSFYK